MERASVREISTWVAGLTGPKIDTPASSFLEPTTVNHESNSITIFEVNYEKKYFTMKGKPIPIETPNCILVSEL